VLAAVGLATCAAQEVGPFGPGDDQAADGGGDAADEQASEEDTDCPIAADLDPATLRASGDDGTVSPNSAVAAAVACTEEVLVVPADDPVLAAVAVPVAVTRGDPLLLGDPADLTATLAALDDPEVRPLEREGGTDAPETSAEVSLRVADELATDRFVAAPADQPNLLTAAAELAQRTDAAVLAVDPDEPAPELPAGAEVVVLGDLDEQLPEAAPAEQAWVVDDGAATAWLFDPSDPAAPAAVTLAALRGEAVVPVSGGDLLARRTVDRVRGAGFGLDALVPVGDFDGEPERDVELLAEAPLLPGGTLRHFDGTRLVALYGRPDSTVLGALGEQPLEATFDRVREVSQGYDADGRQVIPALEVIVTVASAEAGDDGNYSRVTPPGEFRELVDRAAEEDMQVVLDLQPGRNDFLDQARIYEELLREPHVGLALDPEWRLEPDQVHLRQIGSVDAEEVQGVVDWYAELARDTGVAEKLLVLHQFRVDMLPDRDTIEAPREVAVVVHMDGQGPQSQKLETWGVLTRGAEDRWHWAWKNFYDEDPVVAEPGYILDLEPEVVMVTYQ
jgi:hypothetical protein